MDRKYTKDQPPGTVNRIEKVAIIGGAGQMGRHLLEQLLKKGHFEVTVIQRPSSTNKLPSGVKVIQAEYSGEDGGPHEALVAALRGQQALLVTMAVTAPRHTIPNITQAAAKAGVPYILPNWYGQDPANDKLCEESMLIQMRDTLCNEVKRHGVSAYLLLACNFWFEFSLGGGTDRFGFDFQKRTLVWFDNGDVAFNTTTWPQCGRAVANVLSLKILPEDESDQSPTLSRFSNGPIYISSFKVSQRDMFESVKRVTGTTENDWTITRESSQQRWEDGTAAVKQGNYGAYTKMLYSRMFFPTGDTDYQSVRGLDNDILGLPVEDFDEWTATAVRMGENGDVTHFH